jgi:hypothetical protein
MKMKMKKIGTAILMVALFAIAGCGSGSNSGNVNGNWSAVLTDANNNQAFTFTTSLVATNNGSSLTVSNFTFTTNSSCFVSGETESASFSLTGNFNGNVTGAFQLNVISGTPAGNTLTLTGTVTGNKTVGTWVLSAGSTGCASGGGTFTMTKI